MLEKHGLTIEQLGTGMESLSCTQEIYLLKITKENSGQNLNDWNLFFDIYTIDNNSWLIKFLVKIMKIDNWIFKK